jgi:hypothetical protein
VGLCAPIIHGVRILLVITNTSTGGQIITLSPEAYAVAGAGIVLYPGAAWVECIDSSFAPTSRAIYAVSSAAAGTVGVHERVGV